MIRPGVKYPIARFRQLLTQADADQLKMQGYVLRQEFMGGQAYISVVPWHEATSGESPGSFREQPRGGVGTFDPLPPIKRRTPQERMESLLDKVVPDLKHTKGTDSGEEVKAIAQEAMERAERESKGQPAPSD